MSLTKEESAFAKKRRYMKYNKSNKRLQKEVDKGNQCSRLRETPNLAANSLSREYMRRLAEATVHGESCEGYCWTPILHNLNVGDKVTVPIFLEATPTVMTGTVIGFGRRFVRIDFGSFRESFTYLEE